jgi:hypothetical protein
MSRQGTLISQPYYVEMKPVQTSLHVELDAQVLLWNLFCSYVDWLARQQLYIDSRTPTEKEHCHRCYIMLFPLTEIWQWDLKIQHITPNKQQSSCGWYEYERTPINLHFHSTHTEKHDNRTIHTKFNITTIRFQDISTQEHDVLSL